MGGKPVTEIEVREPDLGDSLEAEKEANPALQPTAFQVALACQVLVRAGDDTGPFVPAQFKGLKGKQWAVFREAMQEAEKLGRLTRGREGALLQIMLLASRLGWSRAEILALPLAEAQFYVDQLTKKGPG